MSLLPSTYLRIVRASAWYDILLTGLFATPWSFMFVHNHLSMINQQIGGEILPQFGFLHILFACLLGSLVMSWSVLRIRNPSILLGRYDGVTRFVFSTWMIWALVVTNEPILWLFIIPELAWGIVQSLPLEKEKIVSN